MLNTSCDNLALTDPGAGNKNAHRNMRGCGAPHPLVPPSFNVESRRRTTFQNWAFIFPGATATRAAPHATLNPGVTGDAAPPQGGWAFLFPAPVVTLHMLWVTFCPPSKGDGTEMRACKRVRTCTCGKQAMAPSQHKTCIEPARRGAAYMGLAQWSVDVIAWMLASLISVRAL